MPQGFDYEIEHHGVKGMKWGVRRALTSTGHIVGSKYNEASSATKSATSAAGKAIAKGSRAAGQAVSRGAKATGAVIAKTTKEMNKERIARQSRGSNLEKQLRNVKKINKMSDEEIKKYSDRLNLENNLKRLSDSKGDKASAKSYKNRVKMDDNKLNELNRRLQLEDNLKNAVSTAKKNNQSAMGKHAVSIVANTSMSLLKQKLGDKKSKVLSTDVVFDALKTNAKLETKQAINSSNAPKYKKDFASIVDDAMWKSIDTNIKVKKPFEPRDNTPEPTTRVEKYQRK